MAVEPTVEELTQLFTRVNEDIRKSNSGERVVALSNSAFYAEQISNLWEDLDDAACLRLAKGMAKAYRKRRAS